MSHIGVGVAGTMTLIRRDRATGRILSTETYPSSNHFLSSGLGEVARRLIGEGAAWTISTLALELNTSGSSEEIRNSVTGVTVTVSVSSTGLSVEFQDERGSAYDLSAADGGIQVLRGTTRLARFPATNTASFPASASTWNGGKKPTDENWTYKWDVSFTAGGDSQLGSAVSVAATLSATLAGVMTGDSSSGITVRTTDDSTNPTFETTLSRNLEGASGAADKVSGTVLTITRHRPKGSAYAIWGEQISVGTTEIIRVHPVNPAGQVYSEDPTVEAAQALNYTATISFGAADEITVNPCAGTLDITGLPATIPDWAPGNHNLDFAIAASTGWTPSNPVVTSVAHAAGHITLGAPSSLGSGRWRSVVTVNSSAPDDGVAVINLSVVATKATCSQLQRGRSIRIRYNNP